MIHELFQTKNRLNVLARTFENNVLQADKRINDQIEKFIQTIEFDSDTLMCVFSTEDDLHDFAEVLLPIESYFYLRVFYVVKHFRVGIYLSLATLDDEDNFDHDERMAIMNSHTPEYREKRKDILKKGLEIYHIKLKNS